MTRTARPHLTPAFALVTLGALGGAFALSGCARPAPEASVGAEAEAQRFTLPDRSPTTGAKIAVGNLSAEIEALQERVRDGKATLSQRVELTGLLSLRGQFVGRVADHEEALREAEALVALAPEDARGWLARAEMRGRMHHFADAEQDLTRAETLGADVTAQRAGLREARLGDDEAFAQLVQRAESDPRMETWCGLAAALVRRGRAAEAEALYRRAYLAYRDVSPFAVAWLEFQWGLAREAQGDLQGAHTAWARAEGRLPQYAMAAAHLAEVEPTYGTHARAVTLVRAAWEQTEHPEYAAQLAGLVAEGSADEAAQWRQRARDGWTALLARHPLAYADHAAKFFLGDGEDPLRALELARVDVQNRPTPESHALVVEAALAAKVDADVCAHLPHATRGLDEDLAAAAKARCAAK